MKFTLTISFILSFITPGAIAQSNDSLHLIKTFQAEATDFTVDQLGNVYLLLTNGRLKKVSDKGDSIAVFNEVRRYGKVYAIDVSNPLKVLLYYKEFGTVVVLDRFLNIRTTIDLRKLRLFQVSMIAQSYDNNIWVFDELDSRLKKIGDDGRLIDQFNDFRMIFDSVPRPQFMVDHNKSLYLYDPTKGVYIFDYYGAFRNRVTFTGWTDFTVINKTIYGRDSSHFFSYEPGTLKLTAYPLPSSFHNSPRIIIMPGSLYVLRSNGLQVYGYR
jgi:hypothetical protein